MGVQKKKSDPSEEAGMPESQEVKEDAATREYYDREEVDLEYSKWKEIWVGSLVDAELVRGKLEVTGLHVLVDGGQMIAATALPLGEMGMGMVRLLVPPEEVKKAQKVLADAKKVTEEELQQAYEKEQADFDKKQKEAEKKPKDDKKTK
ncbi:hypothetical protein ACFL54_02940 [Planctomycetota bacterium]